MPTLRLHLVRHPPPDIAPGLCYGRLDVPVSPAALDQAVVALAPGLPAGLPLWSSPLSRCLQLASRLHPAPQVDARLQEMDFGRWEGLAWDAVPRPELDAWAADVAHYAPPGGESPAAMQARLDDFLASLAVPEAILVTHGGVIRLLQALAAGQPERAWRDPAPPFASHTRLELRR